MSSQKISLVDISIGSNMYGRISDLPNTPSHVLAEFVDNAIQSYLDNKDYLCKLEPDYKLRIEIDMRWDDSDNKRASSIEIRDNAAGISESKYLDAFKLAHTPENNKGLNEYGMGMKTAALWLGEVWSVKTGALGENVARTITFDLNKVMANELKSLPVTAENKKPNAHFTHIRIEDPTNSSPTIKTLEKIKSELSSIYRKWLRKDEVDIIVNGEKLYFKDFPVLIAPFARDPKGPAIEWKKDINFSFGKYKARGFIGILKDINNANNGFVLLRRGRVVVGAETDGRYFPKSLSGTSGNFRYKRLFGELELEGFEVAFNKNDIQDRENLEALMDALRGEIHQKDFDLFTQAEEYRLDVRTKKINKLVRSHNNSKKKGEIIEVNPPKKNVEQNILGNNDLPKPTHAFTEPIVINQFVDIYKIRGKEYKLEVKFVDQGKDLVWLDVSKKKDNIIICMINQNHPFFEYFEPSKSIIAILKTMVLAKFTSKENGNDSTAEFFNDFNDYIKETKA